MTPRAPFALLAEFPSAAALLEACRRVRGAGLARFDAHTPWPVHGLDRAMGLRPSPLPWFVLVAALAGGGAIFGLQAWTSAIDYPLVVGGKPLVSWPAFVPITFEVAVLGGAGAAFLGLLGLARLPRHYHPLFRAERFARASDDGFFLSVEAADPRFDAAATAALLRDAGATHVEAVSP